MEHWYGSLTFIAMVTTKPNMHKQTYSKNSKIHKGHTKGHTKVQVLSY